MRSSSSRRHINIIHREIHFVLLIPLLRIGLSNVNAFYFYSNPPTVFTATAKAEAPRRSIFSMEMVEGGGGGGFATPSAAVAERRPIEQPKNSHTTNNSYLEDPTTFSNDDVKRSLLENIPFITTIATADGSKVDSLNDDDDDDDDDDYYNYNNYNEICRLVESNINHLESIYSPVQTIDFLNLVLVGEWKLLFSTNLLLPPPHLRRAAALQSSTTTALMDSGGEEERRRQLRLVNILQKIDADGYNGSVTNVAQWNYEENHTNGVDAQSSSSSKESNSNGSFSIQCTYNINQGSRMTIQVSDDRQLRPAKIGSKVIIPDNVQELVTYLRRSMPREVFDPTDHAMDITYMDADLRIVRYTGPNFEGVRNIFVRVPPSSR